MLTYMFAHMSTYAMPPPASTQEFYAHVYKHARTYVDTLCHQGVGTLLMNTAVAAFKAELSPSARVMVCVDMCIDMRMDMRT